ncbi:MAG: hypothetical protein IKT34_01255, partial [Clostridia bacterium]|nr:hypothetical protein [Clostridia bacterium]
MSEMNNQNDFYNWNGSDNKKPSGGKAWATIAIILGIVAMLTFGIAFSREAGSLFGESSSASSEISSESTDSSADSSADVSADISDTESEPEYSHDPDASVPDFAPDNENVDLSTELSEIYEKCAPSCCTIDVSKNGSPYSIGSGFVIDAEGGF